MKKIAMLVTLLACALLVPTPASAQVEVRAFGSRSMLGIVTESRTVSGQTRLTVMDVVPESPAAEAGLARGDVIVAIDGRPATSALLSADRAPGRTVTLRILRDGTERDVRLVTVERSDRMRAVFVPGLPDSVLGQMAIIMSNMQLHLDSMHYVLKRIAPDSLRVLGRGGEAFYYDLRSDSLRVFDHLRNLPFGGDRVNVFRFGDDSVRVFRFGRDSVHVFRYGPDSVRVRFPQGGLLRPSVEALTYQRASVDSLRARFATVRPAADSAFARWNLVRVDSSSAYTLRPSEIARTSIFAGTTAVAGAELSELNPGLAEYFGVLEGVLVLNVPDGTPAARAGIRPGDVIVQVNRSPVKTIAEIRRAVAPRADASTHIRVLRRGQPIDVTIGRD
jgi:membrane-associated protease RseP (regulator of RpoE activity)